MKDDAYSSITVQSPPQIEKLQSSFVFLYSPLKLAGPRNGGERRPMRRI